jgi:hypothetical protein
MSALKVYLAVEPCDMRKGFNGLSIAAVEHLAQIQQQMVADVAACFGKSAQLSRQMMVYCLFRHGAAMLVRDVVARVGERVIVKQATLRVIQQTLRRIGVQVTQKAVGKTLSRWLPIIGPVLIGGYSLVDTRAVGKTAIDTFSRQIEIEPEGLGDPHSSGGSASYGSW